MNATVSGASLPLVLHMCYAFFPAISNPVRSGTDCIYTPFTIYIRFSDKCVAITLFRIIWNLYINLVCNPHDRVYHRIAIVWLWFENSKYKVQMDTEFTTPQNFLSEIFGVKRHFDVNLKFQFESFSEFIRRNGLNGSLICWLLERTKICQWTLKFKCFAVFTYLQQFSIVTEIIVKKSILKYPSFLNIFLNSFGWKYLPGNNRLAENLFTPALCWTEYQWITRFHLAFDNALLER